MKKEALLANEEAVSEKIFNLIFDIWFVRKNRLKKVKNGQYKRGVIYGMRLMLLYVLKELDNEKLKMFFRSLMKRSLKFKSGKEWHQERRKLRELLVKGTHSKKEWEELKAKHNYMCLNCKRKEPDIKLSKDHITPLAKGGTDFIDNIQPLCRNCNSKKWANW